MAGKCKYADQCLIYKKATKDIDKPDFLVLNVFCKRGFKGWNACKRFKIYELGTDPPKDLLPGNSDSIENILSKNK
ncbi:MAG: hypothetical protein K8S16_13445 [Bacteroidales bacterium]|nr:hypothetical protein [Bacteroidales bacterium]